MSSTPHDSDYGVTVNSLQPGWLCGNGRYTLVRLLARGGMGMVWLAEDHQLREQVALKFLPPEIGLDANALEDFKRETARARKLTHPNIVRIHDFFKGDHEAFISMEFVDGAHLHDLRFERPNQVYSWIELEPLIIQLCEALDYAHREGVIHRDIKPANLIVELKGRLKLADFGFSARLVGSISDFPSHHASSGTTTYMSPAQFAGGIPNAADDIYSLGATIYELLTGYTPFTAEEVPYQLRVRTPLTMAERLAQRRIENEIPAPVNALVMACLAKEPLRRPRSVGLIGETLRTPGFKPSEPAAVESMDTSEKDEPASEVEDADPAESEVAAEPQVATTVEQPVVLEAPVTESEVQPEPQITPVRSRRTVAKALAVFAVLVMVTVAGVFAWNRSRSRTIAQQVPATNKIDLETTNTPPLEAGDTPAEPNKPKRPRKQAGRQPAVKYQTLDFVVTGAGFKAMDFNEGADAFSNRNNYVWRGTPEKFRGWNFTQIAFDTHPRIHVRALKDADVFIAAAFLNTMAPSEMVIPDWQPEGSTFHYGGKTVMVVFRKHLEASEEMDLPKDPKYSLILLFPK